MFVLLVPAWVSSGYSGFLPKSKHVHVGLIGYSKLDWDKREIKCLKCIE